MSKKEILRRKKELEAKEKERQEKWQPLVNKYGKWSRDPARILYLCLVNEEGEGEDQDQWIERIELCFDEMYDEDEKLDPQYRLNPQTPHNYETTILGIMITWQKKHPIVEKFLRGKLDFHKVIDGELYMNKWAWGKDAKDENGKHHPTQGRPVFLAVLFGKTEWLKELLRLGANTDYGLFWNNLNDNCTRLSPRWLNIELLKNKKFVNDPLKDRLKIEGFEGEKLTEKQKEIREEIRKILLVGGADQAKIKGLSNPQGLKLKY